MDEINDYELRKNAEGYKDIVPHDAIMRYENKHNIKAVYRGNVYYVGDNRLGLVISNCYNNKYSDRIEIVYLTTTIKAKPLPTHVLIEVFQPSVIRCESIHTVPRSMIGGMLKKLSEKEMEQVDYALAVSIGLVDPYLNKE